MTGPSGECDPVSGPSSSAPRARRVGPVFWAWLVAVGVDLFLNAGLFTSVFEQTRGPSLLDDKVLLARIPVAYLAVAAGVVALAWVLDHARTEPGVAAGFGRGALVGWSSDSPD